MNGNLKIGELARRTGLTVRALHHYDAIGLLSPSVRSAAGMRLYGREDVIRLHRIQALKQLGCALAEIGAALNQAGLDPLPLLRRQIRALQQSEREARALRGCLQGLVEEIERSGDASADDWLQSLELMTIQRRHLSDGELRQLRGSPRKPTAARPPPGSAGELVAEVRAAMRGGVPPDAGAAQALAWRWVDDVIAQTGNDATLAVKLKAMHESEPRAQAIVGIDRAVLGWIGHALAHARAALFARHLTPAQNAEVLRRQLAGMAHMDAWPQLVAQVRRQMSAGTAPETRAVRALAARWQRLFRDSHCGDDSALEAAVRHAYAQEPRLRIGVGVDETLLRYVERALAAPVRR